MSIPFNNLKPVHASLEGEIAAAVKRSIESGWYILGPEVEAFEAEFASYHGVNHAVAVANGTDAIELALRAAGVGSGDEVITVAHTAVPTVCAIERAGAVPILVDIDDETYTLDPLALEAAVTSRTRAVVAVHLYGHPADMDAINAAASRHGLLVVEDCAQAHGAAYKGRKVGTMGHLAAFSFYPTKNLGALGDGGAVVTNDTRFDDKLRRLRNYGQTVRYHHDERGINSRLDEIQAAILRVKLAHLDEHSAERRALAALYTKLLHDVRTPTARPNCDPVYHLYVIRAPERDTLMASLKAQGIGTLIHYPIPVHLQDGYRDLGYKRGALPVTEKIAGEILSLPLYVGLDTAAVEYVAGAVTSIVGETA